MTTAAADRRRSPNSLLFWLIAVSLAIHVPMLMHLAELYRSKATSYIEVTMRDTSEPFTRSIPRPRIRSELPDIQDVQKLNIRERLAPQPRIDPVESRPETAGVGNIGIAIPELPSMSGVPGLKIGAWVPVVGSELYMTKKDYMEMVRLRIESRKKYPEAARSSRKEGRVKVRFTIATGGAATEVEVVGSSGHQLLDQAALSTVAAASPFPKPPPSLFKGAFRTEIILAFELR